MHMHTSRSCTSASYFRANPNDVCAWAGQLRAFVFVCALVYTWWGHVVHSTVTKTCACVFAYILFQMHNHIHGTLHIISQWRLRFARCDLHACVDVDAVCASIHSNARLHGWHEATQRDHNICVVRDNAHTHTHGRYVMFVFMPVCLISACACACVCCVFITHAVFA